MALPKVMFVIINFTIHGGKKPKEVEEREETRTLETFGFPCHRQDELR